MEQLQIGDGEMLALHVRDMAAQRRPQPASQAAPQQRDSQDPETLRLRLLGDPAIRQQAASQQPELAAAAEDPQRFAQLFRQMQDSERQEQERRRQHIADLNADPFDIDAQMRIAEMIREERVQENLQNAIEYNPEGEFLPGISVLEVGLIRVNSFWEGTHVVH
jgi:DNA damage-inducible protein 1